MIVYSEGLMSLDQSQILISEKFLFIGSKRAVVSKKKAFKNSLKGSHSFSQETCAAEIRSTCRLNQLVVSKMLKVSISICQKKVVRYWVMNGKTKKKAYTEDRGEDPVLNRQIMNSR